MDFKWLNEGQVKTNQIFLLCLEIAKPAGAVNGQDERACARR